jgi:nickel-dependent lactate racemase
MREIGDVLSRREVREWISRHLATDEFRDRRVLLIVPDGTRTAPLPLLFNAVFQQLQGVVRQLDVLVALGTLTGA